MARKKKQLTPDEELELDKAYWELTGYKFNQKKKPVLLWLFLLGATAAAAWYFDVIGFIIAAISQ